MIIDTTPKRTGTTGITPKQIVVIIIIPRHRAIVIITPRHRAIYAGKVNTESSLAILEGEIAALSDTLVKLGLVTGGIGVFSLFSSVALGGGVSVEISRCMRLSGQQYLTGNITFTSDRYTFAGATPTQLSYFGSVTSDIQAQLNNKAPLTNKAFKGTATLVDRPQI